MNSFYKRFDVKVDRSNGPDACWLWMACADRGYGLIRRDGELVRAHRVALERRLGRPIRPGYCSLHRCDNPLCCNPAHLFEGTVADNNRDAAKKGRAAHGENHWKSKLTEVDVLEIRRRSYSGALQRVLAGVFGVSQRSISNIVNRDTWKHV